MAADCVSERLFESDAFLLAVTLNWGLAAWRSVFLRSVASVVAQAAGLILFSLIKKNAKNLEENKLSTRSLRFDASCVIIKAQDDGSLMPPQIHPSHARIFFRPALSGSYKEKFYLT